MATMKFEPAVSGKFTAITLAASEWPQSIRGRVGGIDPVTFTWNSNAFWARLPAVLAIQATRVNGGQPQRTLSGRGVAIADPGAHLVKLTVSQGSTDLVATGIITVPQASIGPGGHRVNTVSVVFYECSELHFYGGSAAEIVT